MKQEAITTGKVKEAKKSKSSWWWMLSSTVLGLILFCLVVPPIYSALSQGELTKATHNLKQIGLGLIEYEDQHKKFPPRLEDIFTDEFIDEITFHECFERTSKMNGLWWYNVGIAELGFDTPHDTAHLVSPLINGTRVILRVDQRVHQVTGQEAMKVIVDQDSTWVPIMGVEPLK